jgi:HSP20 family molecular chaperone IbpA
MSHLLAKVRTRAYDLFERRGRENGHDLEDWLEAENELGLLPVAQIDEIENEIRVRIDCPEFTPDQIKIYAESRAITVEGRGQSGVALQANLTERTLFRRYELPASINTGLVKATLQGTVLQIIARRAGVSAEQSPMEPPAHARALKSKSRKNKSAAA